MSIAFIYNVFDGCELMESALKNSKENGVDENIVVYQTKSYYGNKVEEYDIEEVISYLIDEKLIDKAIKLDFEQNVTNSRQARILEKQKYQTGLNYVYEKKIDYFRAAAVDEFFIKKDFECCYEFILSNNIDRAFCRIITYSDIELQDKIPTDNIGANLLYKAKVDQKIGEGMGTKIRIDDMIKYGQNNNDFIFPVNQIALHHFRLVRINLKTKVNNSTILKRSNLINQINNIEQIKLNATTTSSNLFNIDIDKFKKLFVKKETDEKV